MNPNNQPTRRSFIRQGCCAAVGATGFLSTLAQLRVIGALAGDAPGFPRSAAIAADYKALVCVFLSGGNDTNNVLVPVDPSSHAVYSAARGILAVDRTRLLPVSPASYNDGRSYALHPALPEVQRLFTQGRLAFVANVGTLVRPTTLAQYRAGAGLPPQLFAHSEQISQWQSSVPDRPFTTGWGGRLADLVNAGNTNSRISMSIALKDTNSFQVGNAVTQLVVGPGGVILKDGYPADSRYLAEKRLLTVPSPNLLQAAFGGITQSAIQQSEVLATALQGAPAIRTPFPGSSAGAQLAMIARLISVGTNLGLRRQIFLCRLDGWDLHADQLNGHGPLLAELSAALGAFYDATVELGAANQVTTFTASDFGRTYNSNGDGTDHGWGAHHMVIGGAVKGGDIYGQVPSLALGGPDDLGRGRWLPSISVDEYSATLATWFGVSATDLPVVLPNIGRFARPNLGFMG